MQNSNFFLSKVRYKISKHQNIEKKNLSSLVFIFQFLTLTSHVTFRLNKQNSISIFFLVFIMSDECAVGKILLLIFLLFVSFLSFFTKSSEKSDNFECMSRVGESATCYFLDETNSSEILNVTKRKSEDVEEVTNLRIHSHKMPEIMPGLREEKFKNFVTRWS